MAKNWTPPGVENNPLPGLLYKAYETKRTTKEEAAADFKDTYGQDPEIVFFGKPHGSLIFAGPVPGTGILSQEKDPPGGGSAAVQLELI